MALPVIHGTSFTQLDIKASGFKAGSEVLLPGKSLSTLMLELQHSSIDIFKLDVEGAEYDLIENIFKTKPVICQVLVEFHDRLYPDRTFLTKKALYRMKDFGYEVFDIRFERSDPDGGIGFFHRKHCCITSPRVCRLTSAMAAANIV